MHHNIQARKVTDTMLSNWRSGTWKNASISKGLHLTKVDTSFPSPDGCFFEPKLKTRIAMEFKPGDKETQRGLLTGVGQCIAYLNRHGGAYLVAPNAVSDNGNIGNYLEHTFKKNIYDVLPIGLITYSDYNFNNLSLRCDISERIKLKAASEEGVDVNYWAAWRDTPPHAIYLLLKVANEIKDIENRSKKIWDKFYFTYYVVGGASNTIDDVPSNIKLWDGFQSQIPLQGIKNKLRKDIELGKMTEFQALLEIKKKIDPNGVDNNYRDIKKNHYNFMNHLGLWDADQYLSKHGLKLLEIGDKYGGSSKMFVDSLGYLILDIGRHFELIQDVKNAIENSKSSFNNIGDVRSITYDFLEKRGFIKTNPNRTSTGVRESFSSEFGVWGHFEILNKQDGGYFDKKNGLSFNEKRISELLSLEKYFEYSRPTVINKSVNKQFNKATEVI